MNQLPAEGSYVWIDHPALMQAPAMVISVDASAVVARTEDGEDFTLNPQTERIRTVSQKVLDGVKDMVELDDLTEGTLLHNLRVRYNASEIYTAVGGILISVNPYKELQLYTPNILQQYISAGVTASTDLEPHVFTVAGNAHRNMMINMATAGHQSLVISGESGAGKTEATKQVLQFLGEISNMNAGGSEAASAASQKVEQQILASNPILEAFGNAKTVRNNNSSRFGKWLELWFNSDGVITGANMVQYLLEKVRVIAQSKTERNYHIFFQLLVGTDEQDRAALQLTKAEDYAYLNTTGCLSVAGIDDVAEWRDVCSSFDILSMNSGVQKNIKRALAGILHLGNLRFKAVEQSSGDDGSEIENTDTLNAAAAVLDVEPAMLRDCLITRKLGVRSVVVVGLDVKKASDSRDGLSKTLYGKLFAWLVGKINEVLWKPEADNKASVGVLDIFGFENFAPGGKNSFEQLCINFANEKLQHYFNDHIFKQEKEDCLKEGVALPDISFIDNTPCLQLVEGKPDGIISILDDEVNVPKGSDEGFLAKIATKIPRSKEAIKDYFEIPKKSRTQFAVKHYAGDVPYEVAEFLEKNKDMLHVDMANCMQLSTNDLIKDIFTDQVAAGSPAGRSRSAAPRAAKAKSLGTQFKESLNSLMDKLNTTGPHFIRCLKPNGMKQAELFDSDLVARQLRYAGMMEAVKIRQSGYPVRTTFEDFLRRYGVLAAATPKTGDPRKDTEAAVAATNGLVKADQIGKTKVFLKQEHVDGLEVMRSGAVKAALVHMQSTIRTMLVRVKMSAIKKAAGEMRSQLDKSPRCLEDLQTCVFAGREAGMRSAVMKEAQTVLDDMGVLSANLKEAFAAFDIESIESGVKAFEAANVTSSLLAQARELMEKVRGAEEKLEAATASRTIEALRVALKDCDALGMDTPSVGTARSLMDRLIAEQEAMAAVAEASASRDVVKLEEAMSAAMKLNLSGPDVEAAETLLHQLQKEAEVINRIKAAVDEVDVDGLQASLAEAAKMPSIAQSKAVTDAAAVLPHLQVIKAAIAKISSGKAASSLDDLEAGITALEGIPIALSTANTKVLKEAQDLRATLNAKSAAAQGVDAAIQVRDSKKLEAALALAKPYASSDSKLAATIKRAEGILGTLQEEEQVTGTVKVAISSKDAARLKAALAEASKIGLDNDTVSEGKDLLDTLLTSANLDELIQQCLAKPELATLETCVKKIKVLKRDGEPDSVKVIDLYATLQAQSDARVALSKAMDSADITACKTAIGQAAKFDALAEDIKVAKAFVERQTAVNECLGALKDACDGGDEYAMQDAYSKAKALKIQDYDVAKRCNNLLNRKEQILATTQKLKSAIAAENVADLKQSIREARDLEMAGPEVEAAKSMYGSMRQGAEFDTKITEALESKDASKLQMVLREAEDMGATEESVPKLKTVNSELARISQQNKVKKELHVAITSAAAFKGDAAGQAERKKALQLGLQRAKDVGLRSTEVREANIALQRILLVETFNTTIKSKNPDEHTVATVLRKAIEVGMTSEVIRWKKMLKGTPLEAVLQKEGLLASKARGSIGSTGEDGDPIMVADFIRKNAPAGVFRESWASSNAIENFSLLRPETDFVKKGVFGGGKQVKNVLMYAREDLPAPLTVLDFAGAPTAAVTKEHKMMAANQFKCIRSFMGDLGKKQYPATYALEVIKNGVERESMRDETYMLMYKQLNGNTATQAGGSEELGWKLLSLVVWAFPPSNELYPFIMAWLTNWYTRFKDTSARVPRKCVQYCIARLPFSKAAPAVGPKKVWNADKAEHVKFEPSATQIDHLQEPLTIPMFFADRSYMDLPIQPFESVDMLLQLIPNLVGRTEDQFNHTKTDDPAFKPYGLHLQVFTKGAAVEEYVLEGATLLNEFMDPYRTQADVRLSLTYKRRVKLAQEEISDRVLQHLLFADCVRDCNQPYTCNLRTMKMEDVCYLAALKTQLSFGDISDEAEDHIKLNLDQYIPNKVREQSPKTSTNEWLQKIEEQTMKKGVATKTQPACREAYIKYWQGHPLYGASYFLCTNNDNRTMHHLPPRVLVAINSAGINVLAPDGSEIIETHKYGDVYQWAENKEKEKLVLKLWHKKFKSVMKYQFGVKLCTEMKKLILLHVGSLQHAGFAIESAQNPGKGAAEAAATSKPRAPGAKASPPPPPPNPFVTCKKWVAIFQYEKTDERMLGVTEGEELLSLGVANQGWVLMKNSKGEKGYLPASYVKPAKWTALADYPTEDPRMLGIKQGDQLELVGQPSAGWVMAMRAEGEQGYVPYSYLSQGSGSV